MTRKTTAASNSTTGRRPRPGDVIRQAIADPNAFRAEMMHRAAEMQQAALNAAQAAQTAPDPIDRLERLAALKDRGLLTDDEFERQKRKVLGE